MARARDELHHSKAVQGPDLLLPAEAAQLLRVSIHNVRRNARLGRIPCIRIGGLLRFEREALLEHLRKASQREAEAKAEAARKRPAAIRPMRGDGTFSFGTPKRGRVR